ncbi:MAG TPA: polyprenyl synthetase family protein [Longimicrobiales bacterium]|nr:polyprenyl synthetase family protein [Longimicrobiales bacterium]
MSDDEGRPGSPAGPGPDPAPRAPGSAAGAPPEDAFVLADWLAAERALIEAALERAVARFGPFLPEPVTAAMAHGVLSGGKRLRPVLFGAAYRAAGGTAAPDRVHDLGVSLELIHAYSLMHDDLPCMDDAALRRGRPTTHRVHGAGTTTRAGAALIPMAGLQVLESARALGLPDERGRELAHVLLGAAGAGGMVGGQALDLLGEDRALRTPELDQLHRHKTGALLSAALTMGAVAAGAAGAVREGLTRYGDAIGLAFQVADDILDATATAEELGKEPSDVDLGKSTYVALFGLDEARRRGEALVREARASLRTRGIESAPLDALAEYVMRRRK